MTWGTLSAGKRVRWRCYYLTHRDLANDIVSSQRDRVKGLRATDRQRQILDLIAEGKSDKEIAAALRIAVPTVRTHLSRFYSANRIRNRTEAALLWRGTGGPKRLEDA
jgi:DNA-binding NarL/FixJ family response regulator